VGADTCGAGRRAAVEADTWDTHRRNSRFDFQTAKTIADKHPRSHGAMRPRFAFISRPKEGVGNAGCPLHPQPRVRFALVKSTRVNEYTGITRRSRTQWFYGLLRALPGDRACLTPSSADMACLKPGRARHASANLTPTTEASGPHDFAVRCNRLSSARLVIAHRPKPALQSRRAQNAAASTASHPASVTIAIRPSQWDGMARMCRDDLPDG